MILNSFILSHQKTYPLLLVEYLCLTLPILIILLIGSRPELAAMLVSMVLLLPFIKWRIKSISLFQMRKIPFLPWTMFEWRSGLRKSGLVLFFMIVSGIPFLQQTFVPLLVIILISLLVTSFYVECEPINILVLDDFSPKDFLWNKTKQLLSIIGLLWIPFILAFLFFHAEFMVCISLCAICLCEYIDIHFVF